MKRNELEKLLNGEIVKVGKNQIYFDSELELFVVEKYEYTESGEDMFSVIDGFKEIEDAIKTAKF